MVDIIKRGTLYEDRLFEVTCRRCNSILRFAGSEVTEGVDISYITCPMCDTWISSHDAKSLDANAAHPAKTA
jgi:hypothetical protein